MFNTATVWAGNWQHAVSSRVSTEIDSNPAMSPAYPGSVRRALFEPGYTLMGKVGESELKAGLALQIARSSNQILSQNRDSPSMFFDWSRPSDAGEFGISSRYAETTIRDAEVDATGLVPLDSTRTSRNLSGRWSKTMTERSSLSVNGLYERTSYKGATLVDYATRSGGAIFNYAWSDQSASSLSVSYVEYKTAGIIARRRFANAILGWNWKPSDYLEFSLQMGTSKVSGGRDMGTQGAATMQYTGQRNQFAINAGRQVTPSGLGGFVTADQVNGNWSHDLSEHSRTGISSGWRKNRSITDDISRTTEAWLQHNLNSFWGVRTYCRHRIREGGGVDGASANILGLSFTYTNPDF